MSKSKAPTRSTGISKVALIIIGLVSLLLVIAVLTTFVWRVGPIATILGFEAQTVSTDTQNKASGTTGAVVEIKPEQQKSLEQTSDQIKTLVVAGDAKSIEKADAVAKTEVDAAKESGNDTYVVAAEIARARLLADTGRGQEALDTILFPLLEKYNNSEWYKNDIYVTIAYVYGKIGNDTKGYEYLNKATGRGGL